jgi:ribosomal protein S18 acetylase RimI-like enzyme
MPVILREAALSNAAAIARIHIDTWRAAYRGLVPEDYLADLSYEESEGIWRNIIGEPESGRFVYVAEEEARIFGFSLGGPRREGSPDYAGELQGIYVLPEQQGRGVGRKLTLAVARRLLESGMGSMIVWVLSDNRQACGFYRALGATLVERSRIEVGGTELRYVAYGWPDLGRLVAERGRL